MFRSSTQIRLRRQPVLALAGLVILLSLVTPLAEAQSEESTAPELTERSAFPLRIVAKASGGVLEPTYATRRGVAESGTKLEGGGVSISYPWYLNLGVDINYGTMTRQVTAPGVRTVYLDTSGVSYGLRLGLPVHESIEIYGITGQGKYSSDLKYDIAWAVDTHDNDIAAMNYWGGGASVRVADLVVIEAEYRKLSFEENFTRVALSEAGFEADVLSVAVGVDIGKIIEFRDLHQRRTRRRAQLGR